MAQGSLTAGLAVGVTDVAGAHAIAEAIGAWYGHPHGYCCAVAMPMIMEYNLGACTDKYARLAGALGASRPGASETELAWAAIEAIRALNADVGVPALADLIRAEDLDVLGEKAEANTSNPSNPRPADAAAYKGMLARELAAERRPGRRVWPQPVVSARPRAGPWRRRKTPPLWWTDGVGQAVPSHLRLRRT
jgi:alcohol dehydrogenase